MMRVVFNNYWPYALPFTVFQEFVRHSNKDIEQTIKKEMSGDVKNAFYAIGRLINNILLYRMSSWCGAAYSIRLCPTICLSLAFAVRSVKNQPSYFADRLYKAMKVNNFLPASFNVECWSSLSPFLTPHLVSYTAVTAMTYFICYICSMWNTL